MSRPKRPKDLNQLAKLIADIATGEVEDVDPDKDKDPAAVFLGCKGAKKDGKARAKSLSPERREEIAKKAAKARWKEKK